MRKKGGGSGNVCKEDGKSFGTIVILPLCHSASPSLYYTSLGLCSSHSRLPDVSYKSLCQLLI